MNTTSVVRADFSRVLHPDQYMISTLIMVQENRKQKRPFQGTIAQVADSQGLRVNPRVLRGRARNCPEKGKAVHYNLDS